MDKYLFYGMNKELNNNIFFILNKSDIVKQNIGKINNIYKKSNDWFEKYDDNGSYWVEYIINKGTKSELKIKVIVNKKITKGIYAYEINGKLYYEEINDETNPELKYYINSSN